MNGKDKTAVAAKNLADLTPEELLEKAYELEGRAAKAETDVTNVTGELETANKTIGELEGKLEKAETDVTNATGELETANKTIGELEGKLEKAETDVTNATDALSAAEEKFASQEKTIGDLIEKLGAAENRIKTGKEQVQIGDAMYEVLTGMVPTFGLTGDVNVKSMPASELSKWPEVGAKLVAMGSGIVQLVKG